MPPPHLGARCGMAPSPPLCVFIVCSESQARGFKGVHFCIQQEENSVKVLESFFWVGGFIPSAPPGMVSAGHRDCAVMKGTLFPVPVKHIHERAIRHESAQKHSQLSLQQSLPQSHTFPNFGVLLNHWRYNGRNDPLGALH